MSAGSRVVVALLVAVVGVVVVLLVLRDPAGPQRAASLEGESRSGVQGTSGVRAGAEDEADAAPRRVAGDASSAAVDAQATAEPDAETSDAAPWATLFVDVVDAAGAPVAGVPVALADAWDRWLHERGTSDAEGRAAIVLANPLEVGPSERPVVAALGAFDLRHGVEVALAPPPTVPVRLALPPCGELHVGVRDRDGAPVDGAVVSVMAFATAYDGQSDAVVDFGAEAVITVGGVARFARVEAGLDLLVAARDPSSGAVKSARVRGPAAGATLEFELAFDPRDVLLEGRLIGEGAAEGRHWSVNPIDLARARARVGHTNVQADGDGRFRTVLSGWDVPSDEGSGWLLVTGYHDERSSLSLVSLAGRTAPGQHDLGDVPTGVGITLVSGTVVNPNGEARGARLEVAVRASASGAWQPLPAAVNADATGAFELDGVGGEALEWALFTADTVQPFRPGERGVLVTVPDAAPVIAVLAGRVHSDPGPSGQPLAAGMNVLARTSGATATATVGVDGRFALQLRSPGPVTIELRSPWTGRPFLRLEDVTVPADGEPADPRLDIDLSGVLHLVMVRGFDPDGRPVGTSVREASQPAVYRFRTSTGHALLFDRPSLDLVVGARGWLDVHLDGVSADVDVRFERRVAPVRLRWRGVPELPPNVRLAPTLAPENAWSADTHAYCHPADPVCFDIEGFATVEAPATGPLLVLLQIERTDLRRSESTSHMDIAHPRIVLSGAPDDRVHDVEWDAELILRTLEELGGR